MLYTVLFYHNRKGISTRYFQKARLFLPLVFQEPSVDRNVDQKGLCFYIHPANTRNSSLRLFLSWFGEHSLRSRNHIDIPIDGIYFQPRLCSSRFHGVQQVGQTVGLLDRFFALHLLPDGKGFGFPRVDNHFTWLPTRGFLCLGFCRRRSRKCERSVLVYGQSPPGLGAVVAIWHICLMDIVSTQRQLAGEKHTTNLHRKISNCALGRRLFLLLMLSKIAMCSASWRLLRHTWRNKACVGFAMVSGIYHAGSSILELRLIHFYLHFKGSFSVFN